MYRASLRDFAGTILDAAVYHRFTDRIRPTRLKLWYWRNFRHSKLATLRRINLGCGDQRIDGMCNIDVQGDADLHFNFLNPFPLPSGIADFVFCEHTLEHFHIDQVRHIVKEVRRILRDGGIFRCSVPKVYDDEQETNGWDLRRMPAPEVEQLNRRLFGHEHKSAFSANLLERILLDAGFGEVRDQKEGQSAWVPIGELKHLERRSSGSLVMDAMA